MKLTNAQLSRLKEKHASGISITRLSEQEGIPYYSLYRVLRPTPPKRPETQMDVLKRLDDRTAAMEETLAALSLLLNGEASGNA